MLIELRIAGLLVAAGIVTFGVVRFSLGAAGKTTLSVALLVGGLLGLVAVEPQFVFAVRDLLGIEQAPLSGLVIALIGAVALQFVLLVANSTRIDEARSRIARLVRALALQSFEMPKGQPNPGVVVVIPALNEAENIRWVLQKLPSTIAGTQVLPLVVDDGSSDETRAMAHGAGAAVISHPINLGGGAALRLGYLVAAQLGASVVVTMDADGQHHPDQLHRLVEPILDGRADFVIGSRLLGEHEPASLIRHIGIYVFGGLVSLLARHPITDSSSGYRAFRTNALVQLHLAEDQFHSAEAILAASKQRLRLLEVPITISRRRSGSSKKGPALRYGWGFFRTIVRTWWR